MELMTLTVPIKVTFDELAGLLCSGMEGDMTACWARIAEYKDPAEMPQLSSMFSDVWSDQLYKHIHYPLIAGAAVVLEDCEDNNKEYLLDLGAVTRGLEIMARDYPRHFADFISDHYDAITGDVFIQCCLFEAVLYG